MSAVALMPFGFDDQLVRVTDRHGVAWFVANDVCAALDLGNSREAVRKLDDDEKGVITTDTLGGPQEVTIISESGLYALIFRSRKPVAVRFRKWVTGEVLPALRTQGRYGVGDAPSTPDDSVYEAPHLGTRDDRDSLRVAVLMVREMKDLYGQQAGRQMWVKLGFPVPDVDLGPAPAGPGEAPTQMEGDLHGWCTACHIKETRSDATAVQDLYKSYSKWCSANRLMPMGTHRFRDACHFLFGHEEHPDYIRVVFAKGHPAA